MFVELIAMALSDQFYPAPLKKNQITNILGFSKLVQGLRDNPNIRSRFIDFQDI